MKLKQDTVYLADSGATEALGAAIARCWEISGKNATLVYLDGELGAGKTTLTRGLLRKLGHIGAVKSPTYTLVEPYQGIDWQVFHFDLYRLADAEELEYLGFRDYLESRALCLIEWPRRGADYLPPADLLCQLAYHDQGRTVQLRANSKQGAALFECLAAMPDLPVF